MAGNRTLAPIPSEFAGKVKDTYWGVLNFANIGAGQTQPGVLKVDADGDFIITGAVRTIVAADGVTIKTAAQLLVEMTAVGSKGFMTDKTHIENIAGTAQLPALWAVPLRLAGNATLTVKISNGEGAAINVYMAFLGYRLRSR